MGLLKPNKMKLFKVTVVLVTLSIIISCGTSKGYVGDKISTNELAILNGSVNSIAIDGRKHKERVLFAKVNQRDVGSYSKGWPKNLKVKEGKNVIEVRHFRTWKYGIEYTGGGAIGGIQAGLNQERTMNHHHYVLSFIAEKNKNYLISIMSDPDNLGNVSISLINASTNQEVEFQYEKKIINKSGITNSFIGSEKVDELGNGTVIIYNGAKGFYKNKLNTGRLSIWIDDKLLEHIDPYEYLIVPLSKGKHHVKLLHVDVFNIKSEHYIVINDETKILQVKPTAFSNKLLITNSLPKKFDRFRNAKEN